MAIPDLPTVTGDIRRIEDRVRTLELAGRDYYTQTKTGYVVTQNVDTHFGSWPASNGFISTSRGVAVPRGGIYVVALLWTVTGPGAFWFGTAGRTTLRLWANSVQIAETQPDTRGGNAGVSVAGVVKVAAGGEIYATRYTNPDNLTGNVTLTVASL